MPKKTLPASISAAITMQAGGHYYEGHRKYRHHKGEYRGEHRGGYYGDGRTECPNSNCPW